MEITTDEHGHLADHTLWSEAVAEALAQTDGITLETDHWPIIHAVRRLYLATHDTPPMRLLIKVLKAEVGTHVDSRHLYRLYPDGPVRLASKHAGLPKPKHCM